MNESLPPPRPPETRQRGAKGQQSATPSSRRADAAYNMLADKIGCVPNVRKRDNLYQAAAIGLFLVFGAGAGWFLGEWPQGVLLGGLAGLIAGTLITGAVLTVIGLRRKS
jgi:hypothetical protein